MTAVADVGIRIGLDVGGTKIAGIALAPDGTMLGRIRRPTGHGEREVLDSIAGAVRDLADQTGVAVSGIESVGVGIPGVVDSARGRVLYAVNLGAESLFVADHIRTEFALPCFVENDVKVAGLGAASLREDDAPMAYLNLGTGVAAGFIINGGIWRGARGTAGEIGHLSVEPEGRLCGCGQRGCIETLCGGGALAREWGRPGDLPVKDIFDAAEAGDARALELRDGVSRGAAAAVRSLVLSVDVESVVIGGGLTALGERLADGIRNSLRADAENSAFLRSLHLDERIEMLPAHSPVAAIGAALLGPATAGAHDFEKEISVHG